MFTDMTCVHFGLELYGQIVTDGRDRVSFLGVGPGFYF